MSKLSGNEGLSNPHEMLDRFGGRNKLDLQSILNNERDDESAETLYDAKFVSNYFDTVSFSTNFKNTNTLFKTISLNVESIHAKHDLLCAFIEILRTSNAEPDALLCQECWLSKNHIKKEALNLLKIQGYQTIALDQRCGKKGGLVIYLKEDYEFTLRNLYEDSKDWELQVIDVTKKIINPYRTK